MQDIFKGPVPSMDEERQYILALRNNSNDHRALRGLAPTIASKTKYYIFKYSDILGAEDIEQICLTAIVKAVQRFDLELDVRFITLCSLYMKGLLRDELLRVFKPQKYGVHRVSPESTYDGRDFLESIQDDTDTEGDLCLSHDLARVSTLAILWLHTARFPTQATKDKVRFILVNSVLTDKLTQNQCAPKLGVTSQRVSQLYLKYIAGAMYTYIRENWNYNASPDSVLRLIQANRQDNARKSSAVPSTSLPVDFSRP
jgi:hypothetical protein